MSTLWTFVPVVDLKSTKVTPVPTKVPSDATPIWPRPVNDVAVTTPTPLLLLIGIILGGLGTKSNPVRLSFNILTDPIPVPSILTSVFAFGLTGKNKSGAVL